MPTISVQRGELIKRLGREYTDEEISALCFAFGLELDEVVEPGGEAGIADFTLKIEVPANRYDLLCVEGLGRALRAFVDPAAALPRFRLLPATPRYSITVKRSVEGVRPYVVCAILRDTTFSAAAVKSFIDFQDKLHHTLCRRRALVAIGTHDFDKITPPFFYDARPPAAFSFTPLGCDTEMTGAEALQYLSQHLQLKAYVPLVAASPVLPLISDAAGHILSLPPLINAHFCRVTERSKNIFIECTATDMTKAKVVLNTVVAAFSEYCGTPYTIEPVRVVYEGEEEKEDAEKPEKKEVQLEEDAEEGTEEKTKETEEKQDEKTRQKKQQLQRKSGQQTAGASEEEAAAAAAAATAAAEQGRAAPGTRTSTSQPRPSYGGVYPQVESRVMRVSLDYVRQITGLQKLSATDCIKLLQKMMLPASLDPFPSSSSSLQSSSSSSSSSSPSTKEILYVDVPITRSDVLHACDVAEDAAIAFGYNKLPVSPSPFLAVVPLRALSERVRSSLSLCGYTETLTFALVAAAENAGFLGRKLPAAAPAALDPTQYQLRAAPVRLANAKTREFEQVRTTLIPGVLKTILHNKGRRELPIKCFEVGDVCVLDSSTATGARNLRHCCVAIAGEHFSGLEDVHGVLDVLMQELRFVGDYAIAELEAGAAAAASAAALASEEMAASSEARAGAALALLKKVLDRSLGTFKLLPSTENLFLTGRQVHISAAPTAEDDVERVPTLLGVMGTVHPDTLKAFGLTMPVSLFEINLEAFGAWLSPVEIEG